MSRNSIGNQDKFELASVVTKNTGITSNRRLLVIKAGHLYYYSNIPKFFNGDTKLLQNFHQLPKCSINVVNIKKIKGFESTSSYFSIEFEAKHMMQREDIRKTLANEEYNFTPKNLNQTVTWQFTCDNQFIKQRWVSSLNNLKQYYKKEEEKMQNYFDSIHNNINVIEDVKSNSNGSFSSRSSIKIPWRQSGMGRKSYTLENTKGFQYKESSPKSDSNKLEDVNFIKKVKSDDINKNNTIYNINRPQKSHSQTQFQMVIEQQARTHKIEDAFTISQVKKIEQQKLTQLQPTIYEVVQEQSVPQTPLKDSISYSDSEDHVQRRASMDRTLSDMKLFSETHPVNFIQNKEENNMNLKKTLSVVEEISNNKSKLSIQIEHTPRSNIDNVSNINSPQKSSIKRNEQSIIGCQFQYLLGESCQVSYKFQQRLQKQRQLLLMLQNFKQKAVSSFSDWLESKARGQNYHKITELSNRSIIVDIGNIQLKIALLTTQNIVINEKKKIFFNEDSIKNLKRQFRIYQNLFKFVTKKVKGEPNLLLRMPQAIYIQYKGVSCIAYDHHIYEQNVELNQDDKWLLQKNMLIEEGYKLDWFNFKKVGKYLTFYVKTRGKNVDKDEENLKEYLKKIVKVGKNDKNHNIAFEPPIDKTFLQIAAKQNASTSIQSLQRYVKGLKSTKNLIGACPKQQIITALQLCIFCKQLRKVYRSAQGQIDETHFFNLIFKKDPSILNLLQQSGCSSLSNFNGQLFSFIQYYFGVTLQIDEKVYNNNLGMKNNQRSNKDLFTSSSIHPIFRQYSLQGLEIIESFSKLNYYLESRHHLAGPALQRKKQIYHLCNQDLPIDQSLQILYDEASLYFYESDYIGCIKKCKQYEQICPPKSTKLLLAYLLMIKAYSQFSQKDFTLTLKKATELVQFNYGSDHSCFVNLYSLAGIYYSKLAKKYNQSNEINFNEVALRFLRQAEQMCINYFGPNSKQYLDILLDLSKLYRSLNPNSAMNLLQEAKKLCQTNVFLSTNQNILAVLASEAQLLFQLGLIHQSQNALLTAFTYLDDKIPSKTKRHLAKLQYQLGFYTEKYNHCEEAVQKLWHLGTNQKLQSLQLAYKTAFRESGVSQSQHLIDQNDSVRFQGRQKGLLELQTEKLLYSNLVQMLISSIQTKNIKLLTLVYYLINN